MATRSDKVRRLEIVVSTGGGKIVRSAVSAILMACALCAVVPAKAAEGTAEAGKKKDSMCQGCHGIPDYRTAFPAVYSVPKIGGQHAAYIVKALQAYKSGERAHPTMKAIAATLSDQDMMDLAAFYASPIAVPQTAAAK
jgi:cytochrome c553